MPGAEAELGEGAQIARWHHLSQVGERRCGSALGAQTQAARRKWAPGQQAPQEAALQSPHPPTHCARGAGPGEGQESRDLNPAPALSPRGPSPQGRGCLVMQCPRHLELRG